MSLTWFWYICSLTMMLSTSLIYPWVASWPSYCNKFCFVAGYRKFTKPTNFLSDLKIMYSVIAYLRVVYALAIQRKYLVNGIQNQRLNRIIWKEKERWSIIENFQETEDLEFVESYFHTIVRIVVYASDTIHRRSEWRSRLMKVQWYPQRERHALRSMFNGIETWLFTTWSWCLENM